MSKWSDPALTIDEAILIAEYHPDVDSVTDAYAKASRANTADEPTPRPDERPEEWPDKRGAA